MPNAHVRAATDAGRPELQATAAIAAILTGWFSSSRRQAVEAHPTDGYRMATRRRLGRSIRATA